MSADWFCKIGEKKVGPLNGQQLKSFVAKGQLKPEHLVRRGSEGPWVPAGRIKGLFPAGTSAPAQGQGKSLPKAAPANLPKAKSAGAPPAAKGTPLPSASEAPAPPSDVPQELRLGGHKHHVQLNVDSLDIEAAPTAVSRRKVKVGLKALNKQEQKKLNIILLSLIGGGTVFGLIVFIWAFASGKFGSSTHEKPAETAAAAAATPTESGKAAEEAKTSAEKKTTPSKEANFDWNKAPKVSIDDTTFGNVKVMVLKPARSLPKGAKTEETEVLTFTINLTLAAAEKKNVELTSWTDDSLKKKVVLKDDQDNSYDLLEQVAPEDSDGKSLVPGKRLPVKLIFKVPAAKKPKRLHIELPTAAFHVDGQSIRYVVGPNDMPPPPEDAGKSEDEPAADKEAKADKKKSK